MGNGDRTNKPNWGDVIPNTYSNIWPKAFSSQVTRDLRASLELIWMNIFGRISGSLIGLGGRAGSICRFVLLDVVWWMQSQCPAAKGRRCPNLGCECERPCSD